MLMHYANELQMLSQFQMAQHTIYNSTAVTVIRKAIMIIIEYCSTTFGARARDIGDFHLGECIVGV